MIDTRAKNEKAMRCRDGRCLPVVLFTALSLLSSGGALAQFTGVAGYPSRPIRMIVPFPAGGGYDFMARNIIQLPLPYVKTGRLHALAAASTKRAALAPDIPTMAELGYPIDFDTWYGVFAPAGTPQEIVAKLNGEIVRILALPDLKERASVLGIDLLGTSPGQLAAHMKAEIARWTKVARDADIKVE